MIIKQIFAQCMYREQMEMKVEMDDQQYMLDANKPKKILIGYHVKHV